MCGLGMDAVKKDVLLILYIVSIAKRWIFPGSAESAEISRS